MFTHFHGKSVLTMGPRNQPQKCRLSFRIVPQMNEDYSICQISKEQFRKVKYSVVLRQHYKCCKNTCEYFFNDFYDDKYIPVFLLLLKRFRNEFRFYISNKEKGKSEIYKPDFNYHDASGKISFLITIQDNKQCEICIKGKDWYQRNNKGILMFKKKDFTFYISWIELLTEISKFIKNNEYVSEPFTFRTDLKYEKDKLRVYYKKEKPLLIVNLNECFEIREYEWIGTEPLYWHLLFSHYYDEYKFFDAYLKTIFNPIYLCHKKYHSLLFEMCGIDCNQIVTPDDFKCENYAQAFYLGTSIPEKYQKIFNRFYYITVLIETRNIKRQIESLKAIKKTLLLKNMETLQHSYMPAYSENQNIFDISLNEKLNFERLKTAYLHKGYVPIQKQQHFVNILFMAKEEKKIMIGAFEEANLFDHWRIVGKLFYDFYKKIPSKIECSSLMWDYDAIEEIIDSQNFEICNPYAFKGDYSIKYAEFDKLDENFFEFKSDIFFDSIDDELENRSPENPYYYWPELNSEEYGFGNIDVPVTINDLLPNNCFVMEL